MLHIFIDADACPVKNEIYRVAKRYNLKVTLVAGSGMRIPESCLIDIIVVGKDSLDAADDWIWENIGEDDIVITSDIPLASRCIQKGAYALSPAGRLFTGENIGNALASRNLMSELREAGDITGGPPPFSKQDRSKFLQKFDEIINRILRK